MFYFIKYELDEFELNRMNVLCIVWCGINVCDWCGVWSRQYFQERRYRVKIN